MKAVPGVAPGSVRWPRSSQAQARGVVDHDLCPAQSRGLL